MILGAGLLVLVGLGLFVAGLATGTTVLYWATVAVCAVAAVLLVLSRRGLSAAGRAPDGEGRRPVEVTATQPSTSAEELPAAAADEEPEPTAPEAAGPEAVEPQPLESQPLESQPVAEAAPHGPPPSTGATVEQGEPPVEEVEVTDLLLVVDLEDEVLVVDEHPRYHLAGCRRLTGQVTIPLPLDEARTDGFTPCGVCSPDRTLAARERARRAGRSS